MAPEYVVAEDLDHAIDLVSRHGDEALVMAGGTSLMVLQRLGLIRPTRIIDISDVGAMGGIRTRPDGALEISALTTHQQAFRSLAVRRHCAALGAMFGQVATVRIRNQATVGGNLVHADPAQDPPVMLLALGADVIVANLSGSRVIPLDRFFLGHFQTVLACDEVLLAIRVPALPPTWRTGWEKFRPGAAEDYATVSVAAAIDMRENVCHDARIALGSVGATPLRARRGEALLRGQTLDDRTIDELCARIGDEIDPIDDRRGSAAYKRAMAGLWLGRLLRRLRARTEGGR